MSIDTDVKLPAGTIGSSYLPNAMAPGDITTATIAPGAGPLGTGGNTLIIAAVLIGLIVWVGRSPRKHGSGNGRGTNGGGGKGRHAKHQARKGGKFVKRK